MSRDSHTCRRTGPAVRDSSTNGAMNTAPARFHQRVRVGAGHARRLKARKMTSAFLNRLSFSAPANCVQKNGRETRLPQEVELAGCVHRVAGDGRGPPRAPLPAILRGGGRARASARMAARPRPARTDDAQYLDLLRHVRDHGVRKDDRTAPARCRCSAPDAPSTSSRAFPWSRRRRSTPRSIVHELSGSCAARPTSARCSRPACRSGRVGGRARRARPGLRPPVAPLAGQRRPRDRPDRRLMRDIRRNPDSRGSSSRRGTSAISPAMKLPALSRVLPVYVAAGASPAALPAELRPVPRRAFNIASYALLTHMVAHQSDLGVGDFVWTGGDCHIYLNHLEQVELQLARDPLPLPTLAIRRKRRRSSSTRTRTSRSSLPVASGNQGARRCLSKAGAPRQVPRRAPAPKKKPAGRK